MSYRKQLDSIEGKLVKIITWIQKAGCPHSLEYLAYNHKSMEGTCFACGKVKEYDNEIDFLQAKHKTMEAIIRADRKRFEKLNSP